jgi:ubiquitin C-terminal hydrolase
MYSGLFGVLSTFAGRLEHSFKVISAVCATAAAARASEASKYMLELRRFRNGRQEDAHEYLLCLLDHLHEAHRHAEKGAPVSTRLPGLHGANSSSQAQNQANSFIHSIFGGCSRSQIECMGVSYESSLFEPFLDLSLQIHRYCYCPANVFST